MGSDAPSFAVARPHRGDRGAALLLREHGARRRRDRAVDAAAGRRASGSATSCGARRAIWPAPALAAVATAASARGWFGWLALLAVPLYLVFRSYHTVVARLREEQDETRRAMDVQLATIEALALAIEAQGGLHARAHPIDSAVRGDARRSGRPVRRRGAGGAHGGAAARHRQHGGARAHPVEARGAHARGVRARQDSPARRRRDPAQRAVRRAGRRAGALPSRALGRPRLSGGAARRRHPARRAHPGDCRLLQHAAGRPAVPAGAQPRATRSRCCASTPARRSIRRWSIC